MNKRYFTEDRMREAYKDKGLEGIDRLVGKTECFIMDDFSVKVFKDIREGKDISKHFAEKCTSNR